MDLASARVHDRFVVRRSRWIVCSFVVWLAIAPASAQEPEETSASVEHDAYERGVAAFERGEHAVALHVFRELYERTGLAALRFNIGVCLEQLGDRVAALGEFEAVGADDTMAAGTRAESIEAAARLRSQLAIVTIDGPADAVAVIDESRRCELPCELWVEPGAHSVVLASEGGSTSSLDAVPGGRSAITLSIVEAAPTSGGSLGVLTGLGSAIAAIGIGGIIGFGVRTMDLKAQFDATPTLSLQSDGETMRDLTNTSIAVALLGAALVAIDVVIVLTSGSSSADRHARIERGELVLSF